jgi:aminoglycoside 2'-N-acetyltransferase I
MVDEIQIYVIGRRYISEGEFSEVLELCSRAYDVDYHPYMLTFPDAIHILGRYRDELVSHALWITRWLQCANMPFWRTAYVEAVATDVKYRDKGFATSIMKKVAEEISDYDIGALSTGSFDFYTRLGWKLWRGPLYVRKGGDLLPTPDDTVMVLPLPATPELDLNAPLSVEWREGELW